MTEHTRTLYTEYGPVTVPAWQFRLWMQYGQPDEATLLRMARAQQEHGDANYTELEARQKRSKG